MTMLQPYELLDTCRQFGQHLRNCDNDDFCNFCGHQDPLDPDDPEWND